MISAARNENGLGQFRGAGAAKERRESRGGHTRLDYPDYNGELGMLNVIIRKGPDGLNIVKSDKKIMPEDLQSYVMKEAV